MQVLSSSRGGAATHVGAVALGLVAQGQKVRLVMPFDNGNLRTGDLPGVEVVPYRGVRQLTRDLQGAATVHAHGSRAAFWAWLALLLGRNGAAFVYSIHGFVTPFHREPRRTLQLLAERLVAWRCRCVVADARAERREALRWGMGPPEKVRTVYLGFDLEGLLALGPADRTAARLELGLSESHWHLLCVCRLDRPRDFRTLLEAFAGLPDDTRLHIVGSGPFREAILGKVAALGLGERVHVWGAVRDVRLYYAAADAFVLTSWGWEGCPVTAIEAQAAGLPVVVSDAGGSCESIVPDVSGLLVPRCDSEAMRSALLRVRARPLDVEAGRRHVRAAFGRERMVEELMRTYGCATRTM